MSSLGEEFPKEQARCRKLLSIYLEIGPPGRFAAMILEDALQRADKAVISGDVIAMLKSYEELKSFKE